MTSLIFPTETGVRVTAPAQLVDQDSDRMVAWAERHVHRDPNIAWVLGNFVEADNENNNGHIFPLADLEGAGVKSVANKPLNMLHHENYIVGAYAGAEMVYPTKAPAAVETADDTNGFPYMEALAAMWRHIYPDEYQLIAKAQKEGNLYFSMEAVAESLTFIDYDNITVPYMGRQHDSYPTKDLTARRILNKPHFGGGAIIIPPVRPGWSRADIKSLDSFISDHPDVAEAVFAGVQTQFTQLNQDQWERMMADLIALSQQN